MTISFNDNVFKMDPIEAGMYFDKAEKQLYVTVPSVASRIGPRTYNQDVIRSDGAHFECSIGPDSAYIVDPNNPSEAIRMIEPMAIDGRKLRIRTEISELKTELDDEPWTEDLLSLDLLHEVRKHVVLPEEWQYYAFVVWCAGTHLFKVCNKYPFLHITSHEAGSGKTTLLTIASEVAANAEKFTGITDSALVDTASGFACTIILDEFDKLGRAVMDQANTKEILNSLFDRGSVHRRKQYLKPMKKWIVVDHALFNPTVITKLSKGGIPETIRDRSITILMKRLSDGQEQVQHQDPRDNPAWEKLYPRMVAWGLKNAGKVYETYKAGDHGDIGLNRRREVWNTLLSVAKHFSEDAYKVLLAVAQAPEPTFEEDLVPSELEPVSDFFEKCRVMGKLKIKMTDVITNLGSKLPPDLRSSKSLVSKLEPYQELLRLRMAKHGPGGTMHVFLSA